MNERANVGRRGKKIFDWRPPLAYQRGENSVEVNGKNGIRPKEKVGPF